MSGLINRFEIAGVQLSLEVGDALVSDRVESFIEPGKEAIFRQLAAAVVGVLPTDVEPFDQPFAGEGERRHVLLLVDHLEDPIVDGHHPVGRLTQHVRILTGRYHNLSGVLTTLTHRLIKDYPMCRPKLPFG